MTKDRNTALALAEKLLGLALIAFVFLVFWTPLARSSNGYIFSVVPLGAAAALLLSGAFRRCAWDKKLVILSALMAVLFVLQLSITDVWIAFSGSKNPLRLPYLAAYTGLLAVAVFVIVYWTLSFALRQGQAASEEDELKKLPFIRLYYVSLPVVFLTVFYLIAGCPPFIWDDYRGLWAAAASNAWSEWHTIGYFLFFKLTSLWSRSEYSLTITQGLLWIAIFNYGVGVLYRVLGSKKLCLAYSIAATVLFTPELYTSVALKDPVYCMFMLLFVTAFIDALHAERVTWKLAALLTVSGIAVCIFRHAGWASVLTALVIWCVFCLVRKKNFRRVLAITATVLCGFLFVNIVVSQYILHAEKNPAYVKYSVPMYMIGALSNKIEDIPEEDVAVMEQVAPLDDWRRAAASNRYWADPVSRDWGEFAGDVANMNDPSVAMDILKLNLKWLLRYPKEYISSYLDITSILWEIGRPIDGYEWPPIADQVTNRAATPVARTLSNISSDNKLMNPLYWRGGIWAFNMLLCTLIILLKRQYRYLMAFSVPVITYLLLFVSIPSQDPRYVLFLMECGLFCLFFSVFIPKKEKTYV